MEPIVAFKGRNGRLELYEDFVRIDRGTMMGFLMQGLKGQKDIYFDSITSIQVKKPGMTVGFIQFSIPGGVESKKGVFSSLNDENTVSFGTFETYEKAIQVKDYIESRRRHSAQGQAAIPSLADELSKLLDLKAQGILTDQEFESAKKRILESS